MKEETKKIIQAFSKSKAGYIRVSVGGELIEASKLLNTQNTGNKTNKTGDAPSIPHKDKFYEISSKNVGRYHAPEQKISEGQKILLKDSLGYIESMGLKHDIPFNIIGSLHKIYVQDGDVVEFGQILFLIQEEQ